MRWLWWRVNAEGEIGAMVAGLGTSLALTLFTELPYELSLIATSAASVVGLAAGMGLGARTDAATLGRFVEQVRPHGFWPGRPLRRGLAELGVDALRWAAVAGGIVALLAAAHRAVFLDEVVEALLLGVTGAVAVAWGARERAAS